MTNHPLLAKLGLPIHPRTHLQAVGIIGGKPIWPVVGADGTQPETRSPMLQRFYAERDECIAFVERTLKEAQDGTRDLSGSESETLSKYKKRIGELDAQIKPIEEFEALRGAGDQAGARFAPAGQGAPGGGAPAGAASAGHTPALTQARAGLYKTRGDVIVDQIRAAGIGSGGLSDVDARDRLLSAGVIFPGASDDQIRQAQRTSSLLATESRVTQVSGDTPGILPVPVIGEVMNDVDNARPFISSVGAKPLNFAGETFKRPVVTQHVAVGKQTTQATSTGLGSQKMTIGSVTFTKETWGGWLDVSRQEIDWTSPAAWNAILDDLTDQYGITTENAAGDAFAAAVTAQVEVGGTGAASTLKDYITALYAAAALAYAGAGRLPDTIWMSLDMWGTLGPLIESQVATMKNNVGDTEVGSFDGNLLRLPRFVVPSFPAGTLVIGAKRWTEVYEERIGLLQAVLPSVLGVQIAYGGYVAYNTLKAAAFAKVVNLV